MTLAYDSSKLVRDARDIYARGVAHDEKADAAVQRNRARIAVIRVAPKRHAQRRAAHELRSIVLQKLDEDCLPCDSAPRVYGAPGVGGICDACDSVLSPTQLVMSVPWPSRRMFAHLHADCFMAWNAVRGMATRETSQNATVSSTSRRAPAP